MYIFLIITKAQLPVTWFVTNIIISNHCSYAVSVLLGSCGFWLWMQTSYNNWPVPTYGWRLHAERVDFPFGKKMMESLFSIMHQVLGHVPEDVHHWDIAFFCPKPFIKRLSHYYVCQFCILYSTIPAFFMIMCNNGCMTQHYSSDNGLVVSFYICYFNSSFLVLNLAEVSSHINKIHC
jgi:hypothetical protein